MAARKEHTGARHRAPSRLPLLPLALVALTALFLAPYLFLGRSMLPLELVPIFQPWARHARELWENVAPVHNPLLDTLQQYYPRRVYMREALAGGWLPLWNPGVYGGTPFLAAQQGAALYPPAWLLALFAPEMQTGWSALLHLSLAAVGTFLFLRRLDVRPAGAMAGAVAFAFNGFMVVWLAYPNVGQWTLAWLPLALYCWERGRAADDLCWLAACGLVLALNLLGGHGQSSAYVLLSWGLWALFRTAGAERPLRGLARWVVLPAAVGIGLSLGHLLPVLEYVPLTDRAERIPWEKVQGAGMPLAQLWTFLLPRLFGDETLAFAHSSWLPEGGRAHFAFVERSFYPGVAVLVLGAGAWAARGNPEHRRLALFSAALSVLALLLAFATPLYWPLWRFLPGFGSFTAIARIVCMAALPLASLAALGVHALEDEEPARRGLALRAVGLAAGLLAGAALLGHFIYGGAAPAEVTRSLTAMGRPGPDALAVRDLALALAWMLGPALLAGLAARGVLRPGVAAGLAAGVIAADLFAFGFSFNPAAETRYLHRSTEELVALRLAEGPFRFLSAGPPGEEIFPLQRRMPSNLPSTYGLADINGSDSFVPLRYGAWLEATRKASGGESPWSRFGSPNLRAAAVRYYLTGGDAVRPGLESVVGAALQRDPRALPYARLHTRVETLATEAELLQALAQPDRAPAVALTAGAGAPQYGGAPAVVPFQARRTGSNRLALEGTADQPGLLIVAEAYAPGWRARVDGRPARVVPADHWMVGVPLEAGQRRAELSYEPGSFRAGLFLSLLALAGFCALLAGRGRERIEAANERE